MLRLSTVENTTSKIGLTGWKPTTNKPVPLIDAQATATAYTRARSDVQALIVGTPRKVLDIGCSDGSLLAALGWQAERTGIELDPVRAQAARVRLDRVLEKDALAATGELRAIPERFDLVVCADVLEHLSDPDALLANVVGLMSDDGQCIVSLPNVRFWTTFWQLGIKGRWPKNPWGIHDATHLRWFTYRDALDMFDRVGLAVDGTARNVRLWDYPARRGSSVGRLLGVGPLRPFFTQQYLFRLRHHGSSRL